MFFGAAFCPVWSLSVTGILSLVCTVQINKAFADIRMKGPNDQLINSRNISILLSPIFLQL